VAAALSMGAIGYFFSDRGIFFFVVAFAVPTLWALARIRADEIDYDLARGAGPARRPAREPMGSKDGPARLTDLLKNRGLAVFLLCAVMFHFANAAMLPLLGEMLSKGHGRASMMFMSACVVTTQMVITLLAGWAGAKAGDWGRKPLLLIAFAVLPIRGVLYTLTHDARVLVAIQILDGIGAGIFGVVSVLVIADLTRGSGRFNVTLGAIGTAVGMLSASSRRLDAIVMRAMDGVMSIPAILLAIALMAVTGGSVLNVIIAVTIVEVPRVARLIRGVVLSLREQPYVEAAISVGTTHPMIVIRHLLPGIVPPLTVQATFVWATAMILEAALSFIGAGTPPSTPSWGNILADARALWQIRPTLVFFPAGFLFVTLLAVNMLGDGLRDLLDPRQGPED